MCRKKPMLESEIPVGWLAVVICIVLVVDAPMFAGGSSPGQFMIVSLILAHKTSPGET